LFILAGLAVCAAGVILPAENDLQSLQRQLDQLRAEEVRAYARLKAHSDFMDQVDRADPALVTRLAATQLRLLPASDRPILLAKAESPPVTAWIDGTVNVDIRPSNAPPTSTLSRLANGPYRLWLFGGGIMSVFVGLLMSPGPSRASTWRWPAMLATRLGWGAPLFSEAAIVEPKPSEVDEASDPMIADDSQEATASEEDTVADAAQELPDSPAAEVADAAEVAVNAVAQDDGADSDVSEQSDRSTGDAPDVMPS
jgi:hypothetical protein